MSITRPDDLTYWEKFYKEKNMPFQESPFARFVAKKHLKKGAHILELGCGNGRDAIYFSQQGYHVVAVDQCEQEISFLKQNFESDHLQFIHADFSQLKIPAKFDVIYSRFTMHAISKEQQDMTLRWSMEHLNPGGLLLIEARSRKNELYGLGVPVAEDVHAFVYEGHYRRFLDRKETLDYLNNLEKTKVVSAIERRGFAPFQNTNYKFMRIVAQKTRE